LTAFLARQAHCERNRHVKVRHEMSKDLIRDFLEYEE